MRSLPQTMAYKERRGEKSIMDIRDFHNKEVETLKKALKRSQMVTKTVWEYRDYIEEIKEYLGNDELEGAGELWNDLPYNVQTLLITAPSKGGVFTTKERDQVKSTWKVSIEDVEANRS